MKKVKIKLIPCEVEANVTEKILNFLISLTKYVPTGVNMINAPVMWNSGFTGKGVKIAVLDTGCCTKHPDLKNNIIGGRNFTSEDNGNKDIYEDYNGHGTHCAGTIAGTCDKKGIMGVAPNAKLLILKVLDKNGNGNAQGLYDAINYAIEQKVDIISMSLGMPSSIDDIHTIVKKAVDSGISVVCASGNEGDKKAETNEFSYPAGYNEVISVGAVDNAKSPADFTNSNREVDLVAPGVKVISTYLNNEYYSLSGTSMACPHVSGALALIKEWSTKEFGRELTEVELYAQLIKKTDELKVDRRLQGNGILHL